MKKIFSIMFLMLCFSQTAFTPANYAAFFRGKVALAPALTCQVFISQDSNIDHGLTLCGSSEYVAQKIEAIPGTVCSAKMTIAVDVSDGVMHCGFFANPDHTGTQYGSTATTTTTGAGWVEFDWSSSNPSAIPDGSYLCFWGGSGSSLCIFVGENYRDPYENGAGYDSVWDGAVEAGVDLTFEIWTLQ